MTVRSFSSDYLFNMRQEYNNDKDDDDIDNDTNVDNGGYVNNNGNVSYQDNGGNNYYDIGDNNNYIDKMGKFNIKDHHHHQSFSSHCWMKPF